MVDLQKMKYEPLKIITQAEAVEKANAKIYHYMNERYPGLKCRWDRVNSAVGGYFRFGEVTTICGASGSGKSYLLNMLRDDFTGDINKTYPRKFKILSFSFEMSAEDEILRTYSGKLKMTYSSLLSSFSKLSEDEYKSVLDISKNVKNDKIHYVESTGNYLQIISTIDYFHKLYPEHQLVITLDHTLLAEYLNEGSEVELVSNIARLAIIIKKRYNALVLILSQLNDKIEQVDRLENELLHYPTKKDIHGSKSIYMASDTVIVIHRPETLGIDLYGKKRYPTKGLVALHFLKSRLHGKEGIIRMKADFDNGNLIYPYELEEEKKDNQIKIDLK